MTLHRPQFRVRGWGGHLWPIRPHRLTKPRRLERFHHRAELAPEEKQCVLLALDSPRFAGKSVAQAYTILLDEGCYLCSRATMHRLLRERGTSGERRAHAVHPARKNPGFPATSANLGYPGTC